MCSYTIYKWRYAHEKVFNFHKRNINKHLKGPISLAKLGSITKTGIILCKQILSCKVGRLLKVKALVAQSCQTLCDPMDCRPPGSSVHGFSRQEYWSGLPFPSPGDLPDPETEPRSPSL